MQKGSPIFTFCKRALPYFTAKLTWIPGNGAKIKIWEDSILGDHPFNSLKELGNIKAWLLANNYSTLWDISSWGNDDKESWVSWNLGDYLDELKEEALNLLDLLQGKSSISARSKDQRGWGSGSGKYSASAGYAAIMERPWVHPNPVLWKALWNFRPFQKLTSSSGLCFTIAFLPMIMSREKAGKGLLAAHCAKALKKMQITCS